jgi:hypothetical protein
MKATLAKIKRNFRVMESQLVKQFALEGKAITLRDAERMTRPKRVKSFRLFPGPGVVIPQSVVDDANRGLG